jgi:thiopurine S-methyltransferase
MDARFWHERWGKNEIGFHEAEGNALLVEWFKALSLTEGDRVLLPLCGKTRDIAWLLSNGYRVAGNELSAVAIEHLFVELGMEPKIAETGDLKRYCGENIDIFVGDFFQLSRQLLGPVDATYDRAALVALPEGMRDRYTAHLVDVTYKAPQLLLCFEYDQNEMDGPPFSVNDAEVRRHYAERYELDLLASINVPGGLKGKCVADEKAWLLQT